MDRSLSGFDAVTQQNIDAWLKGNYDENSKIEIRKLLQESPEKLIDAFYTHLSFGTGGLRGKMGLGPNRLNVYTIRAASQALANYLAKDKRRKKHSVLIGFDCRNNSRLFATEAARVLAANNIEVFLYNELRPVASVSFGVMHKGCSAGVLITASHNPPEYNGYKVYWNHGGQVLPPHDSGIIKEYNQIKDPSDVKRGDLSSPFIHFVDDEIDKAYLEAIQGLQINLDDNREQGNSLKVVYTSLHGSGITMIPKALESWGFTNVTLVESQKTPDGNFPTVKSPNPEEASALALGIETLMSTQGDILLATDPDADRLALVVMHHHKPVLLNGSEVACLALDYICSQLKEKRRFPPKPMFVKTIVTTELFKAIVDHYQASCLDVLTGFKYIGGKIGAWDEEKKANVETHHFIFGGEESYGYLYGTHARDKDAIVSSTILCEAALHLKLQNKTFVDQLHSLYKQYGVYREKLISLTFEGKVGMEKIHHMMTLLRQNPPKTIGETYVESIEDYSNHTRYFPSSGRHESLVLPSSDVLRFFLKDKTKIVVRPSGTEPKLKIYAACIEKHHLGSELSIDKAIETCDKRALEYVLIMKKLMGVIDLLK